MIFINVSKDFLVPSMINAASSANRDVSNSVHVTLMPFISGCFVTLFDSSSIQIINKYGDNGRPCLTPLWILKKVR